MTGSDGSGVRPRTLQSTIPSRGRISTSYARLGCTVLYPRSLTPRAKLQCASRADSVNSCGMVITVSGCHCFFGRGARSAFPAGGGRETQQLSRRLGTSAWERQMRYCTLYLQTEIRSVPDGSSGSSGITVSGRRGRGQ